MGHWISSEGIGIQKMKIACFQASPFQKTFTNFVHFGEFAVITGHMWKVLPTLWNHSPKCLRKGVLLEHTPQWQEAFNALKATLTCYQFGRANIQIWKQTRSKKTIYNKRNDWSDEWKEKIKEVSQTRYKALKKSSLKNNRSSKRTLVGWTVFRNWGTWDKRKDWPHAGRGPL